VLVTVHFSVDQNGGRPSNGIPEILSTEAVSESESESHCD
jgi:hypothetical protein